MGDEKMTAASQIDTNKKERNDQHHPWFFGSDPRSLKHYMDNFALFIA